MYKCKYCGKEWSGLLNLNSHENQCHSNPNKRVITRKYKRQECEYCHKMITINNYKKHIGTHINKPEEFIKVSKRQSVTHDGLNCIYCGKLCKHKNSLAQHEIRCKENPNRLDDNHRGGGGWNKGLTKETDERVLQISISMKKAIKDGKFKDVKHSHASHPHSEKTKQRLREVAIERGLGGHTYIKSYEYNGIYFDSNWELLVAKDLDKNGIKWTRPDRLYYIDCNGKKRYYFPDFYLIDYNVYLDPKNEYILNHNHSGHNYSDREKIKWVEEQNDVRIIVLNETQLNWEVIKTLI